MRRMCDRRGLGMWYWALMQDERGKWMVCHVKETGSNFDDRFFNEGNYFATLHGAILERQRRMKVEQEKKKEITERARRKRIKRNAVD